MLMDFSLIFCLRKLFVQFSSGAFDKHFEKLMDAEPRFLHMCKSPFQSSRYLPSNFHNNMVTSSSCLVCNQTRSEIEINSIAQQQEEEYPSHLVQHNQVQQATWQPCILYTDANPVASVIYNEEG